MKFSLAIEKKNRANIGTVKSHNNRLHPTVSQLPVTAWITPQGHHKIILFNADLLEKAKDLAKRKDAVLAVELVVQVGNQTDWRELPTLEHPHGKPKPGAAAKLNALIAGVKAAAISEFGAEKIISVDLHTDESTPHAHIVFAPIFEGKLQAKHWLDGATSCAVLRAKIHAHVNKFIACDYEKGAPGGDPHDPSKAAGGANAPKPEPGFLEKTADKLTGGSVIKQLKATILELNQQLQTMFSRLKSAEKRTSDDAVLREKAIKKAQEMHALAEKQKLEIKVLEQKVAELTPKIEVKKPAEALVHGLLNTLKPRDLAKNTRPKF